MDMSVYALITTLAFYVNKVRLSLQFGLVRKMITLNYLAIYSVTFILMLSFNAVLHNYFKITKVVL